MFTETQGRNFILFGTAECGPELLKMIDERFETSGADALILGQGPVLTQGFIDPRNMECLCPVLGTFAVRREAAEHFGKPDEHLGKASAAEIAAYIKDAGGKTDYAADIIVPYYEFADSITEEWLASLLLDYKLGNRKLRRRTFARPFSALIKYDETIGNYSRSELVKALPRFLGRCVVYLFSPRRVKPRENSLGYYDRLSTRGQAVLSAEKPDTLPLVSIVVRTHSRPETLRKTLETLRSQGYPNLEIKVVEDGLPTAKEMIEKDFSDLPVAYYSTGVKVGRAAAGNMGFRMSRGEYINLLDDDDFLYPGHIMAGITEAQAKASDIVFLQGQALAVQKKTNEPYDFDIISADFMNFPRVDEFTMSAKCVTPDNGVLFKKELLEKTGGMREELGAHEDWSLWLKLMTAGSYTVIPYATSAFVNPAESDEKEIRENNYRKYRGLQFEDDTLRYNETPERLKGFLSGLMDDAEALIAKGQYDSYLMKEAEYWDVDLSDDCKELTEFNKFCGLVESGGSGEFTAKQFNTIYKGYCARLLRIPENKRKIEIGKIKELC